MMVNIFANAVQRSGGDKGGAMPSMVQARVMSMIFRYDIGLHCTVPYTYRYTFTIYLYVAFAVSARVLDILCI